MWLNKIIQALYCFPFGSFSVFKFLNVYINVIIYITILLIEIKKNSYMIGKIWLQIQKQKPKINWHPLELKALNKKLISQPCVTELFSSFCFHCLTEFWCGKIRWLKWRLLHYVKMREKNVWRAGKYRSQ